MSHITIKRFSPIILTIVVCTLFDAFSVTRAFADEYKPELFESVELVYDEPFAKDGPHQHPKQWVIRQKTQWVVKDGVLVGGTATEEYQKKMQAAGDTHDGMTAPLAAASAAVPEPSTCVVLLCGMMAMLFRRNVVVS